MLKKILFYCILIIVAGGLFYTGITFKHKDNGLIIANESSAIQLINPAKFPDKYAMGELTDQWSDNTVDSQTTKSGQTKQDKPDLLSSDNGKRSVSAGYTYFFLPPAPVTIHADTNKQTQKIYLSNTGNSENAQFESWQEAVTSQGYDFNDTDTMKRLKNARLEFQTLAEVETNGSESLNIHIENIKNFIIENSAETIEFSDDMLLGDLWEKLFEIDIEVKGVSSELKTRYIESFYNIPVSLEKELEIAKFPADESTNNSISSEKEKEIEEYLASEKYANLENTINEQIKNSFDFESLFESETGAVFLNILFAPIGSELESHPAPYEPPLAGQCGGNTRVSDFPPGYNTFATCCSGCPACPPCIGSYCDCICGCTPPVAYIWDAVTGICGCGE